MDVQEQQVKVKALDRSLTGANLLKGCYRNATGSEGLDGSDLTRSLC